MFRRRRVARVARSDVTPTSGRLFSPDCPLNRPLDVTVPPGVAYPLGVALGPVVTWTSYGYTRDDPGVAVVDLSRRTVRYVGVDGSGWAASAIPLDGPARGYAAGLVLLREAAAASVDHAVAVIGPWPSGTRLAASDVRLAADRSGPGLQAIVDALRRYGAVVAARGGDGVVWVVVETPTDLGPWADDPGPVYRWAGIVRRREIVGTATLADLPLRPDRRAWFRRK